MNRSCLFSCAAMLLFAASATYSQTGNAIVKGAVTDPSGSAVTQAKVRLTNANTNVSRDGVTSSEGLYYFGDVTIHSPLKVLALRNFQGRS
jgi:hypothetical protein